ncbi:MAG: DUF4286 family protein [Ferruginibacter sp.]
MILYNVTVKVDNAIAEEWLQWINNEHIPDMLSTGCFSKATVLKLLEVDESDGPTYAIQYHAVSKSNYNLYIDKYAGIMRTKSLEKWQGQFIAFRSVMQVVH